METAVWRALAVFRALGLGYAVVVYALRRDEYLHPVGGWLVLVGMAGWTVFTALTYRVPSGRRWSVLSLDLVVAVAAVISSRYLDDPDRISQGAQTLPVVWAAAPVLAFAIRGGWQVGLVGASAISIADLLRGAAFTAPTANNIVLLLLAGAVVGYVVSLARRGEAALARALVVESATHERERLSRDIHDGVLQVLALVGRRGRQAGGEAAEIGRLAAEQEQALRALVSFGPDSASAVTVDLRGLLRSYASSSVTVSTPGTPVLVGHTRGREVAGAVGASLANVEAHAGRAARAWVLLEDEGAELVVSIRDDGVGFAPHRLAAAVAEGRIGVSRSITGRLHDLGGTAVVTSAPGAGTEIELRLPRESP
jgi:signal transduction histidine kinase